MQKKLIDCPISNHDPTREKKNGFVSVIKQFSDLKALTCILHVEKEGQRHT